MQCAFCHPPSVLRCASALERALVDILTYEAFPYFKYVEPPPFQVLTKAHQNTSSLQMMHFPQVIPAAAVSDQQNRLFPGFAHNITFSSSPEVPSLRPLTLCMVLMLLIAVLGWAPAFDMSLHPGNCS